jgi:transposase
VVQAAHVFIGVLGASSYTYAEASLAEDLPSWIGAHVRMFEFFGGVPEMLVPDNLKCGVTTPNYYEPDINPTYQEMAEHYDVAVVPARIRRPRDKAKAENGVLLAERWVMAALRNRTFFSLAELNAAIREKIEVLNQRSFQKLPGSRCSIFEQEERAALKPLPLRRYQYADRKRATVHIDYHVELDGHYYSVPYILARKPVEIRWTSATVEVLRHGKRVASHVRSYVKGKATTLPEHMPPRHRSKAEWTPERMVAWAGKSGEWTAQLVDGIMANCQHPEQGFRSCLGVMRLCDKYGAERLEAACRRAVTQKGYRYKIVKAILEHNLDQPSTDLSERQPELPCIHENVRGAEYYN